MPTREQFNETVPTEAVHAMHSMIAQARKVRPDGWGFIILMADIENEGAIVCTQSMSRKDALFILSTYCLEAIQHDERVEAEAKKSADAANDNERG